MQNNYQIYQGDCLKLMKDIEDDKLTGDGDYQKTKADVSVGRFSNLFRDDSEQTRH